MIWPILKARAEILEIFRCIFGKFKTPEFLFWDYLTFRIFWWWLWIMINWKSRIIKTSNELFSNEFRLDLEIGIEFWVINFWVTGLWVTNIDDLNLTSGQNLLISGVLIFQSFHYRVSNKFSDTYRNWLVFVEIFNEK